MIIYYIKRHMGKFNIVLSSTVNTSCRGVSAIQTFLMKRLSLSLSQRKNKSCMYF